MAWILYGLGFAAVLTSQGRHPWLSERPWLAFVIALIWPLGTLVLIIVSLIDSIRSHGR